MSIFDLQTLLKINYAYVFQYFFNKIIVGELLKCQHCNKMP